MAAANAVIQNNTDRLGKNLRTDAEAGEKIRFFAAYNDIAEADFIVNEIKELKRENWQLNQIALLYRSNAQSRVLEQALFQASHLVQNLRWFALLRTLGSQTCAGLFTLAINPNDDMLCYA